MIVFSRPIFDIPTFCFSSYFSIVVAACLSLASYSVQAEYVSTGKGRILLTQGHSVPACRTVVHVTNDAHLQRTFRIPAVSGKDDIAAVVLSALLMERDIDILFDPAITSGCGTEPAISYATIY